MKFSFASHFRYIPLTPSCYNVFHNVPSVVLLSEERVFLILFDQCDRKENAAILEIIA